MRVQRITAVLAAICLALTVSAGAVSLDFVVVGNPGNASELSGYGGIGGQVGAVAYDYQIGKYEVTAGQYTEFLNLKAAADPYGLYSPLMATDPKACGITQSGGSGSFTYATATANLPVNFVSWGDAARFANWIENGQGVGSTETGAYALNGATSAAALGAVIRNGSASYFIASEDEWYKAAFHKNDGVTGNYWDYATQSNTQPTAQAPPGTDMVNGSANYNGAVGNIVDVGSYTAKPSDSAYGTFDQSGNVFEWTDSVVNVSGIDFYIKRGGGFMDSTFGIQAMGGRTGETSRTAEKNSVGFRMVSLATGPAGDMNGDGNVDGLDIDELADAIRLGWTDAKYDLTGNGPIDTADLDMLVRSLVDTTMGVGTGSEYGDFNLDGLINTVDLTRLATYFGPGSTWAEGNANRNIDLTIDTTDLTILGTYFGFDASVDTIPEPATLFVMGCGAVGLLRRRRS